MMTRLSDYTELTKYIKPPGFQGTFDTHGEDEARYILKPDHEFDRPWLASPQGKGGVAFVWPLGVEGFQFSSSATAGIHHYIGDNDVYIDIVYPDEYHITLNGLLPGRTSIDLIPLLRQVILHQADPPGNKLLSIPPAAASIYNVKIISYSFEHDQTDFTHNVTYSIEFIRTGVGSLAASTVDALPSLGPSSAQLRGSSSRTYIVKSGARSFASLCNTLYGNSDMQSMIQLYTLNERTLARLGILFYKIPYALIPAGTLLHY